MAISYATKSDTRMNEKLSIFMKFYLVIKSQIYEIWKYGRHMYKKKDYGWTQG